MVVSPGAAQPVQPQCRGGGTLEWLDPSAVAAEEAQETLGGLSALGRGFRDAAKEEGPRHPQWGKNDVAKYFGIIPAMFIAALPGLADLNVMRLATPQSAVLSALIFDALIIPALIPLALHGVRFKPAGAEATFYRNLVVYGAGGLLAPFIGIKLIDLALSVPL
jgi:hypothetical protein